MSIQLGMPRGSGTWITSGMAFSGISSVSLYFTQRYNRTVAAVEPALGTQPEEGGATGADFSSGMGDGLEIGWGAGCRAGTGIALGGVGLGWTLGWSLDWTVSVVGGAGGGANTGPLANRGARKTGRPSPASAKRPTHRATTAITHSPRITGRRSNSQFLGSVIFLSPNPGRPGH